MDPIGNTTAKSYDANLRQSQNRQGILADLRPSSPSPPRAAAVAPQIYQRSKQHFSAMHSFAPGGNDAGAGQSSFRYEEPLHGSSREHMVQTMTFSGERAYLLDSVVNRLLSDDHEVYDPKNPDVQTLMADFEAVISDAGLNTGAAPPTSPVEAHPPVGGSPGPYRTIGQTEATLPGETLETPSGRAAMACDGENANLFDSVVNRLLSDDYELYDPENPNILALMADYTTAILDAAPPTRPVQEHPPVGESPGPYRTTGQTGATLPGKALEGAAMASGGQIADLLDSMMNSLLSDDYDAYDPEGPNVQALMAEYESTICDAGLNTDEAPPTIQVQGHPPVGEGSGSAPALGQNRTPIDSQLLTGEQRQAILHIFMTNPEKSNKHIANEIRVSLSTIKRLRRTFDKTGDIKVGDRANRLSADQRRAILQIFETDPQKSNRSIADEMGVGCPTILSLRKRFDKTGDTKAGDRTKRLSADQRRAILQIFKTDPKRSNESISDGMSVSLSTIKRLRRTFDKTGDIKAGDHKNRLTDGQRRAILQIFETDPKRSNQSLADEFGVSAFTIAAVLRGRFSGTGSLKPRDFTKRLSADQRRAILQIFETDLKRKNESIADEMGVSLSTIKRLRKQFGRTGNIETGDVMKRLSADQRQAISQIFETDPERSNQSIADDFGVAQQTIRVLKRRFEETGDIKTRDQTKRLSADQRRTILQIFETDPKRSNQSIADEFGVSPYTITLLKSKYNKTGNLKVGHPGKHLSADQRRAILQIFGTDPKRSNQSIADEFGVAYSTVLVLRKRFGKQAT